ncbi:MAG: tetratricopeptide repeat protein [Nitrospirae bacterium]|nr:tetratricopeptide repeat protein [Nitrospirota bacterium]
MADKAKILQNAQRYMAKGQIDKAIDEWQKLISESPNDGNIYNTIGDLLLKKNDLPKAVDTYLKGAEVFHTAGFSLKTIAIYKKLIKLVPQRIDIIIKLGDLNAERGLTGNAIEDYLTAAKQYSQEGNVKEALDVYRKIANLDPSNTAIRMKLAELCLKEGMQQDAVGEFVKILESYLQTNQRNEAEILCQRILKLDPKNEAARKLTGQSADGDAAVSQAEPESKEQLLSRIDGSIEKNLLDDAQKLLSQFMERNPDNPVGPHRLGTVFMKSGKKNEAFEMFKTAARRYLELAEYGQAGKLMKDYLETDPDRIEAHMLLADVYEKGGNPHLAVSSYAHVIDEYLASGEPAQARGLYIKIKTLEAQHRDVRRLKHAFETAEVSQVRPAPTEEAPAPETADVLPPTPAASVSPLEPATEAVPTPVEPAPAADPAALHSLFMEAEVYLKYGLSSKAMEQLQQVLAMDPDNETAHVQLKDIYKSEGQTEKAVAECFCLMEIYKKTDNPDRRAAVLEEAKGLDPENPRIREATDLAPLLDSGRMKAILDEPPIASKAAPPSLEVDREDREPAVSAASSAEISSGSLQAGEDVSEQMAEADFYYQQGLRDEAKKMYELILALQPDHPGAQGKLDAIATEETLEKEKIAQEIKRAEAAAKPLLKPAEPIPASVQKPKEPKPVQAKSADEQMLDEELDKSFAPFMSGETEESVETADRAGAPTPEDADGMVDLEALLKEEDVPQARPQKRASPLKEAGEDKEEFVDLSGMIDEEVKQDVEKFVAGVPSEEESVSEQLDSIFSEFQKDAQEQIDDIDHETHYNLGIAYKEMGLLNEAMIEFKQSMKGPDRFIDSCNMLAACHQENGNDPAAIELLERALSDPRCEETQAGWLRYDLASLYEKGSRLEEALGLFNEIARSDRNFKDVALRIETLEGLLGKPKKKIKATREVAEEDEDVDAMMERVFGESSPGPKAKSAPAAAGPKEDAKKKDRISYL